MITIRITRAHLILFALLLAIMFGSHFASAWTNPTQAPPNGNVSLPSAQWTASGTAIYNSNSGNVGIGITGPGQKLSVAGTIESTSGGFRFPDGTSQTSTAKESGVWASTTGSRAYDTVYQNTSGKKRRVTVTNYFPSGCNAVKYQVDSANPPTIEIGRHGGVNASWTTAGPSAFSFEVPNNHYYRAAIACGAPSIEYWFEMDE